MKKTIIIILETIALLVVVSFAIYLLLSSSELVSRKQDVETELRLEQGKEINCEKTIYIEVEVNWKESFDSCTQEKFLLGDEIEELNERIRDLMGIELIKIPTDAPRETMQIGG